MGHSFPADVAECLIPFSLFIQGINRNFGKVGFDGR